MKSETPNLDWLLEKITRMKELLDDPHPGLFTWQECYSKLSMELVDFWTEE